MPNPELELIEDMAKFHYDPKGHALYSYPWGKDELEGCPGPRKWQAEILQTIGQELKKKRGQKNRVVRIAVASGHDIGKTALTSMIIKWAMDTSEDTKIQVTANTGSQLRTRTWAELAKWNRMSMTSHWFELTATSFYSLQDSNRLTWRCEMAVWRENRTEAFAGMHNYGKRIVIIFDEASGIPLPIWETADGICFDEDTEIIFIAFGNPTRSSGGFWDVFHNKKEQWPNRFQIDSRTVEGVNTEEIEKLLKYYDADSDYFRVRVRGEFPRASALQFIPTDWVAEARKRKGEYTRFHPLLLGIDIAAGGDDRCVFYFRRGFDGKNIKPIIIPGEEVHDSTKLADKGIEIFEEWQPDAIFGDATGIGKPILDVWKKLGWNIFHVNFGGESQDKERYVDKSAEMWADTKEWLNEGGAVWDDPQMEDDLCQREYGLDKKGRLFLESKKDMKKRGLHSPDIADALVLTFAHTVALKMAMQESVIGGARGSQQMKTSLDKYKFLDGKKRNR